MHGRIPILLLSMPVALLVAAFLLAPKVASASGDTLPSVSGNDTPAAAQQAAGHGFHRFCDTWLDKLAKRERANLAKAKPRKNGSGVVLEYTGYSKKVLRCDAKATGISRNPFVGKMVYTEGTYRKIGATLAAARKNQPQIMTQTEVMVIFRYDGSRWVY
jgi:hypothetical protein